MKDQPSSEHQGESRLRITSVLPRRAETLVAGELRGAMPATGEQLTLTTPTGAHSVVVHDVTTLDSALEHAARSGAEILSSPSSRPLRCAFVLTGISAELLKAGDTVSFLAEGGQESQVEDRSLEATVSKAVGDPNRDTARVHLVSASAEEAERRVQSALPTSWKVWKKTVLSGGEKGNIERRAESSERALAAARQNLPPEATVLDERVEHHRSQDPVEVEAFSEDEARIKAQETSKWIDATNVRLKSRGRSRFLGIGRRPNVYEVFFREQVRAEITYQEKAIFEIIAINTAKVSDRECGAQARMKETGDSVKILPSTT